FGRSSGRAEPTRGWNVPRLVRTAICPRLVAARGLAGIVNPFADAAGAAAEVRDRGALSSDPENTFV
ncbi:MAG: hypothetical protein M3Z85_05815, partial [Acidobacteriota bacterium]|nr:hypothetical protein [Acidobacteriota bacterium]